MATVVWDMRVRAEAAQTGLNLIRRIWADMAGYAGYLSHRLLQDEDDAGHFLVVSHWTDRESADRTLKAYANAEPVALLNPILAAPRQRFVMDEPA